MIKRNRHKISKISVKKKRNSRHVLNKASVIKAIRRKNRDMSKGIRATMRNRPWKNVITVTTGRRYKWSGINNIVINTETVRLGWHVALTF
jgi:hypothetical protein